MAAYTYNPTLAESALLAQIRQNESGNNYANPGPGTSTASGAYQFINSTWQMAAQATGVGTQYASAADAPAWVQDTNALWLLRTYGANSTAAWAASGPYDTSAVAGANGSTQPLVDLSGAAAATSTSEIMSQIGAWADTAGVDLSVPTTEIVIALALGAVAYLALAA